MSDASFRERYPVLYHLREHPREYAGLALAFIAMMWVVMETTLVVMKMRRTFRPVCVLKVPVQPPAR